jgi:predicted nucleotidyltransferase
MEDLLQELAQRLARAAGGNLQAIILYGSAATGEYRKNHSDLNVLCILHRTGTDDLEQLHEPLSWWKRKGFPVPQVFTEEELRASADIFAIELLDMKVNHRMIFGDDFLPSLDVPTKLHKLQVERELRTNLVRLRQGILSVPPKDRVLVSLMDAAVSAFVTLFRHALLAFGEPLTVSKRHVVRRAAEIAKASPDAFFAILDLHEGKRKASDIDAQETLRGYMDLVERMTNETDRRLAASSQ